MIRQRTIRKGLSTDRCRVTRSGQIHVEPAWRPDLGTPWYGGRRLRMHATPEGWPHPYSVFEGATIATRSMYKIPGVRAFRSWACWYPAGDVVPMDQIREGAENLWLDPRFRLAVLVTRYGAPSFTNVLNRDTLDTVEWMLRLKISPLVNHRCEAEALLTEDPWFRTRLEMLKEPAPDPQFKTPLRVDAKNPWKEE